jgi:nitroimidazol reductase NimA-like FMN-containing flavoprotein (pyridoxamine 5'-phosphate oxidase superfamily)
MPDGASSTLQKQTENSVDENAARRSARSLSDVEIKEFLSQNYWAVLAISVNNDPYGVPIIYGYDDDGSIYIANGPGKKITMLEQNPRVTMTVVEVAEAGKRWRSVIVRGDVVMVADLTEKMHAFNTLRKQMPESFAPRMRDAAKLAMAKVVRIVPIEITGRAIGY